MNYEYHNGDDSQIVTRNGGRKFWGVFFLVLAALLLTDKIGLLGTIFKHVSIWKLIISVVLIMGILGGLQKRDFGEILIPGALLLIVNRKMLGFSLFSPWAIFGAAVLATIGLNILFPNAKKGMGKKVTSHVEFGNDGRMTIDSATDIQRISSAFCKNVKYLTGEISQMSVSNAFGSLEIYLNDVVLLNQQAVLNLESAFGDLTVYVPAEWRTEVDMNWVIGKMEEVGSCNPAGGNLLVINGNVAFGQIRVIYH